MIDTIKPAWVIHHPPADIDLEKRGWTRRFHPRSGKETGWALQDRNFNGEPRLTIFRAPNAQVYLTICVSLPSFVNGSNTVLLEEGQNAPALDELAEFASLKVGMPFYISDAFTWGVDFAIDIRFREEEVTGIIGTLANMNIAGFKRTSYRDTSVYFQSGRKNGGAGSPRVICIYSKQHDCIAKRRSKDAIDKTCGIVRFEYRFRKISAIRRLAKSVGVPNIKIPWIANATIATNVLSPIRDHAKKMLQNRSSEDPIAILRKMYGARRLPALITFLFLQRHYGVNFHQITKLGYSRSAYYRCQKACRDAGIFELPSHPVTNAVLSNNC